jgi:hypothetical protein
VKSGIFIFVAINFSLFASAQTWGVVASACANNIKGDLALSWTIGQVIASNTTAADKSVNLTQGLQEKMVVTSVKENIDMPASLRLYPNPAGGILNIQYDEPVDREIVMIMVDSNGNSVRSDIIGSSAAGKQIDMQGIPPGIYYIRLTRGNIVNIYKVVKL